MDMHRLEKLSREIVREASKIVLYELNDPRMGFVTVTRATITPDLKLARIYVSILGDKKQRALTLHALEHAHGFIQRTLGHRLEIRCTPEVIFVMDETVEKLIRIQELISKAVGEKKPEIEEETNEA